MLIPLLDVTFEGLPDWSLSERDVDVLSFLSDEEFQCFTFEGLKRRLGLHPETLSRILNRLEAEGAIKKSSEGYTVTKEIAKQLKSHSGNSANSTTLLQTFLPSDMPPKCSFPTCVDDGLDCYVGLVNPKATMASHSNGSLKTATSK
jgi:hypothetical protein